MSFKNAQQSRLLAGSFHYSGVVTKIDGFGFTFEMLEVTTLIDTAKKFICGLLSSAAKVDMLLDTDTTAGGQWSNMTAWDAGTTQPQPVTFAPAGLAAGSECWMVAGLSGGLTTGSTNADKVTASLDVTSTGPMDPGVFLEDLTTIAVDTSGTARDNGALTANGGAAHLHVTDLTGLTGDQIIIEHSTTGVGAWATLVTFANVTALTSERVEVAPGTTVNRYLRVGDDVTGTGSITRSVAFSRR